MEGLNKKEKLSPVRNRHELPASRQKVWLFRAVLVSLPLLFFIALELMLRLIDYGPDLRLFSTFINDPKYRVTNASVGKRYFFQNEVLPAISYDALLKQKPPNAYRIFVLGGSSAAGYPYYHNAAFSRMLRTRLQDHFPDRHLEVFNLGLTAVNSFTILDFVDELIDYEPDAFLIYAGHNEFYGALGIASTEALGQFRGFVNFYLKLQHLKTFYWVRNTVTALKNQLSSENGLVKPANTTLMERMVKRKQIVYHSPDYFKARDIFEGNLRDIFGIARDNGVRVLASELVSNLKEQPPFESLLKDSTDEKNWQAHFERARRLHESRDFEGALREYDIAFKIDEGSAILSFEKARCLESLNRFEEARFFYYKAKDLDALRFRASEDFNESIYRIANEFHVPVLEMKSVFESASPNGLLGKNLMLEHLHPNLKGYFLMAKVFAEGMKQHQFISPEWNSGREKSDEEYWTLTHVTPLDLRVADIKIDVLLSGWPFKKKPLSRSKAGLTERDKVDEVALQVFENELTWEEGHVQLAEYYTENKELAKAVEEYRALIHGVPYNVSPYLRLGLIYLERNRFAEAQDIFLKSLEVQDTAIANKWIGSIYVNNNEPEKGLAYLKKAVQMNQKDPEAIYNISVAFAMLNKFAEAKSYCRRILDINPQYKGAQQLWNKLKLAESTK